MQRTIRLRVNGVESSFEAPNRTLLVHLIRDRLGLTGTHVGCDTSHCGACTVILNGKSAKSCTMFAVQADGGELTTIEGLASDPKMRVIQESFRENFAIQCGYCTPGFLISSYYLLNKNPNPTEEEVKDGISGNLCRCEGYRYIVEAVLKAAAKLRVAKT